MRVYLNTEAERTRSILPNLMAGAQVVFIGPSVVAVGLGARRAAPSVCKRLKLFQ